MPALRRLVGKSLDGQVLRDGGTLHKQALAACRQRNRVSELLHSHLDDRGRLSLRRASAAKTTDALQAWWTDASQGNDVPGAFWATLTHPRCTPALQDLVLGQVPSLWHRVGMACPA